MSKPKNQNIEKSKWQSSNSKTGELKFQGSNFQDSKEFMKLNLKSQVVRSLTNIGVNFMEADGAHNTEKNAFIKLY